MQYRSGFGGLKNSGFSTAAANYDIWARGCDDDDDFDNNGTCNGDQENDSTGHEVLENGGGWGEDDYYDRDGDEAQDQNVAVYYNNDEAINLESQDKKDRVVRHVVIV